MASSTPLSLLTFLLLLTITMITPSTSSADCTAALVSFSTCLPYTAAHPNNASSFPTPTCCATYSNLTAPENTNPPCLCYLLRDPNMLGFPLNSSRLLSLSSACSHSDVSLPALCSDFESLYFAPPPMESPAPALALAPQNLSDSSSEAPAPMLDLPPTSSESEWNSLSEPPLRPPPEVIWDQSLFQSSSATKYRSSYTWFLLMNYLLRLAFSFTVLVFS